jgi:hypothetical protein
MILSYVPNQLLVGQTCRKIYDLSCSLETYTLIIETTKLAGDSKKKITEFLEDESIFASIVNSKRRIEKLFLEGLDLDPTNSKELQAILENVGAHQGFGIGSFLWYRIPDTLRPFSFPILIPIPDT